LVLAVLVDFLQDHQLLVQALEQAQQELTDNLEAYLLHFQSFLMAVVVELLMKIGLDGLTAMHLVEVTVVLVEDKETPLQFDQLQEHLEIAVV
jgi:hypothetical protein